jgi:PKD repeat protein
VTYSTAGTKTLSVTVTDSASATATDTATVTVTASGSMAASAGGPYTGTAAAAIAITGSGSGGTAPYTCAWSGSSATFGSASSCSTTVRYTSAGTYTISLTVTDASSATATSSATVTVGASAPTCVNDYAGDGLQASADPTGLFEITRACAQTLVGSSVLRITIETQGMALENALGAAASPVVYTAYVDGLAHSWSASHGLLGAGWSLRDDGTGSASAGTASSTATALTIDIPLSEIDSTPGFLPSTFLVRTRTLDAGVGLPQLNLDSCPGGTPQPI